MWGKEGAKIRKIYFKSLFKQQTPSDPKCPSPLSKKKTENTFSGEHETQDPKTEEIRHGSRHENILKTGWLCEETFMMLLWLPKIFYSIPLSPPRKMYVGLHLHARIKRAFYRESSQLQKTWRNWHQESCNQTAPPGIIQWS